MSDWSQIKQEYEAGELSQSALAKKHGISRTAIQKKALKESWVAGCRLQVAGATSPTPARAPLSLPADAHSIARIGLHQLAQHLQASDLLSISSHKSLSDALCQYVKVLASPMEEQDAPDGLVIPLDRISARTRMEIRRLLAEEEEQQRREGAG